MANQGHWYGGGETLRAAWPLEKGHIKLSAFVTGDEVRLTNNDIDTLDIVHYCIVSIVNELHSLSRAKRNGET